MKYKSVTNCVYSSADGSTVDCDVDTDQFGVIPTTVDMVSDSRASLVVLVARSDIAPYSAPVIPEPTAEEKIKAIEVSIQDMLNRTVKLKGYDSIDSCGKYCGYDNAFRAECELFCGWAAACWSECYSLLAQFNSGAIQEMTADEVLEVIPDCPVV